MGPATLAAEPPGELVLQGARYQSLRLHKPWRACPATVAGEPCDAGAVVVDPRGEETTQLTVLACPPPACVTGLERCPQHSFIVKVTDGVGWLRLPDAGAAGDKDGQAPGARREGRS